MDLDDEFVKAVHQGLIPKLEDSAYCAVLVGGGDREKVDVQWCVELGAMIMLDKPIMAIAVAGQPIPNKLRLVADEIVELDSGLETDESQRRVHEALTRMGATLADNEGGGQ